MFYFITYITSVELTISRYQQTGFDTLRTKANKSMFSQVLQRDHYKI